jgi:hypothetical protein
MIDTELKLIAAAMFEEGYAENCLQAAIDAKILVSIMPFGLS